MKSNVFLLSAAMFNGIAALVHVGCIIFGAPWYRFFGAGEQMALLAEQGSIRPTLITLFIVIVLLSWTLFTLSAARLIVKLPFLKLAVSMIALVYLSRGIGGLFLINNPLGRSPEFWLWSSLITLFIAMIHFVGLTKEWKNI